MRTRRATRNTRPGQSTPRESDLRLVPRRSTTADARGWLVPASRAPDQVTQQAARRRRWSRRSSRRYDRGKPGAAIRKDAGEGANRMNSDGARKAVGRQSRQQNMEQHETGSGLGERQDPEKEHGRYIRPAGLRVRGEWRTRKLIRIPHWYVSAPQAGAEEHVPGIERRGRVHPKWGSISHEAVDG